MNQWSVQAVERKYAGDQAILCWKVYVNLRVFYVMYLYLLFLKTETRPLTTY